MIVLLGDLQGCDAALGQMLERIGFSASRDHLVVLGDLVNRGPASLAVLRRLKALGTSATCLLGNHDLHLLATAHGAREMKRDDTLQAILSAPDRRALLDWVRHRPLTTEAAGWFCVHAGLVPGWTTHRARLLAEEVEAVLRSPEHPELYAHMYGNTPDAWSEQLSGWDRLRFIINVMTRLRFCSAAGRMDFALKESAEHAPPGLMPWFEVPGRASAQTPIAFGHWSTLGLINRPDLLALDTGCVWGGCLTAVRVDGGRREVFQVQCPQAQRPGG